MTATDDTVNIETQKIWQLLEAVSDPEIPVLSILDLGIVRKVILNPAKPDDGWEVAVFITPTYSGCPAMDMIAMHIRLALIGDGYKNIEIIPVLSPAWTTDWMTEAGKIKLKNYGIAPPTNRVDNAGVNDIVECPQCHSSDTKCLSEFGSTACKSLYQCNNCKEPFDHFKCH